jgi:hypothetical protein
MVERVYGLGYNVLVSFRRGRLRLLLGPSSVSCVVRVVVVLLLVDVSELLEVVDEPSEGLMSVVTGGLVLLTVSVVVAVVVDEVRDELDPPGSM